MMAALDMLRPSSAPTRRRTASLVRAAGVLEALTPWALAGPAAILLVGLFILPVAAVFVIALTDWQFGADTFAFVGLANFREVFADPGFRISLTNTIVYVLIVVPAHRASSAFSIALLIESRQQLARLLSRRPFPALHGDARRHGDRLGSAAASDHRPRQPDVRRRRAADRQLAARRGDRAAGAGRDRHLAEPRLRHGAVPRRAEDRSRRTSTTPPTIDGADRWLDRLRTVTLPMLGP